LVKIAAYVYPSSVVNPTGIGMLTLNMALALARNPEVDFCLVASEAELGKDRMLPADNPLHGIPTIGLPWSRSYREGCWLATNYPVIDRYVAPDYWIYNSMETYVPANRCRRIVTVHHFDPLTRCLPLSRTWCRERLRTLRLRRAITTAELVIAQSSFTKNMIIERYGLSPERIAVVGSGVAEADYEDSGSPKATLPEGVCEPYILSVGVFVSRKGADYLIALAQELRRRQSPLQIVCPVGIYGEPQYVAEGLQQSNMVLLGRVRLEELHLLMKRSVCMVLLSRLEGFGLTAVEGMAAGTPVVASNNSALPETLGGAGVLVDPTQAGQAADVVTRLLQDAALRSEHIAKGRSRVRYFSWEACMNRLLGAVAHHQ